MGLNDIRLPAVKEIHLVFDYLFIRKCLKKRNIDIESLNWPKAIRAMYRECEIAENKLLHMESVCRTARETKIAPFKAKLEKALLRYTGKDYV
jgi:hypothetical protein